MKDVAELTLAKSIRHDGLMNFAINLNVKRVYTDVNGTVINKAVAPVNVQVKFPVFILGSFDFKGGYRKALESCPPESGVKYLKSFINGIDSPSSVMGVNIASNIEGEIKVGDLVSVYTDSFVIPSVYVWIIVSANNASIGSIINNLSSVQKDDIYNRLYIEDVHYLTTNNNVNQWNEPIFKIQLNNLGLGKTDSFQPLIYRTPYTFLNNVLIVKLSFKATQFMGFSTFIQYNTDQIQFVLNVKK